LWTEWLEKHGHPWSMNHNKNSYGLGVRCAARRARNSSEIAKEIRRDDRATLLIDVHAP